MKTLQSSALAVFLLLISPGVIAESMERNCSRFSSIVIPALDVKDATVEEVFEFLNQGWKNVDPHVKRDGFSSGRTEGICWKGDHNQEERE